MLFDISLRKTDSTVLCVHDMLEYVCFDPIS